MIDPNWLLEDLDPRTWRAIGQFFYPIQYIAAAQPNEHGLFVLHDRGLHPRVVDTATGVRTDLGIAHVHDPRAVAARLFNTGEWDRVHVIDRQHLAHVVRSVSSPTPREPLDAHYHRVYQSVWDGSDGYVALPPHPGSWHGWSYSSLKSFVARLPSPSSIGLVVLGNDRAGVEIGLAAHVVDGRIKRLTTLEGLPRLAAPCIGKDFLSAFCVALDQALAPAAMALVCTRAAFDAWLYAGEARSSVLRQAIAGGEAILHNAR